MLTGKTGRQNAKRRIKKAVSFVTASAMLLSIVTSSVPAIEVRAEGSPVEYMERSWAEGSLTELRYEATDYTVLTENMTEWSGGTYVASSNTTIADRIVVTGDVKLILCDNVTLTAVKGITVANDPENSLTVYGQTGDNGVLYAGTTDGEEVTADEGYAGIGGTSENPAGGTITMNGGVIYACGGNAGAGIGGGNTGVGGTVTINGGKITAIGGADAMGIGKGKDGTGEGTLTVGTGISLFDSLDNSEWTKNTDTNTRKRYMKAVYPTYTVTVTGGANAVASGGGTTQSDVYEEMVTVTYTANSGYRFEEFSDIVSNGITATRTSSTVITVSGTPTADVNITVPDAVSYHVHEWNYSANGTVITATCGENCPNGYDNPGFDLTISGNDAVYDGARHGATLDSAAWTSAAIEVPAIQYTGVSPTTYNSTTAPAYNGTYIASVTAGSSATASVQFTISAVDLSNVSVVQDGTLTYNGSPQVPQVITEATSLSGEPVTFTYSTEENGTYGDMPAFTNVGECGTVYYKADAPGHNTVSGNFTVTMNKGSQETPEAPTLDTATINSITLNTITNGRYKCGDGEWQESPVFSGLIMNTEYTFYQKKAGDDNQFESASSVGATIKTSNHVHNFTYAASGDTITGTCDNSDGGHSGEPETLKIVAPSLTLYGGEGDAAATLTGTLTGISNPDIVYKKGDLVLNSAPTDAGTYTASITLSGVNLTAGGTGDVTASVEYTIAKADISPEVSIDGWTYGDAANVPTLSGGNPGGGNVSFEFFTDSGCSEKTSSLDGAEAEGAVPSYAGTYWVKASVASTDNYSGGSGTTDFAIAPKALSITAKPQTITYGSSIASDVSEVTATGIVNGDTVFAIALVPSTSDATNSGTITPGTAVIKRGGTVVTGNYNISYEAGTLTVEKRSITVTAADQTVGLNGSVATDISKVSVTLGELVAGDVLTDISLVSSSTDEVTTSGTITPSGAVINKENAEGRNVTGNYDITYLPGTLTVTQAIPSLTPPAAKTLAYTGSPQVLIDPGTVTGGTLEYSLNGTAYTDDISSITGTDAGEYIVRYKVIGDANHSDLPADSLPVTIAKKAAPADVAAGEKPTAKENLQYTGSALTLLNAPASLPEGYAKVQYCFYPGETFADAIPTQTDIGSYSINVKYIGDANHADFVLATPVAVTISPRKLSGGVTVSFDAVTFSYGAATVTPSVTVTITEGGTVLSEGTDYELEYVGVSPTEYAQSATAPSLPGTYKVVLIFKGNYTGTYTSESEFSIVRRSDNPVGENKTITFDGSTYDLSGLFSFAYTEEESARTYSILAEGTTGAGTVEGSSLTVTKAGKFKIKVVTAASETISSGEATAVLTVSKGSVTGSIAVEDITYGETLADPVITGNPAGAGHREVEYKETSASTWTSVKPVKAGSYRARVTLGGNDLYEGTIVTADFVIDKATLTVTADDKTKERDKADPTFTYTVTSGLVEGDDAAKVLTGHLTRETGEDVGSYAINKGTLAIVGNNYTLNFVAGTFTITKATHKPVASNSFNSPTVPSVSSVGLTVDAKKFISPAPAEEATYTVTGASGIVVATPLPTVTGSVVTYSVSACANGDTGTITVTVNDPNYEPYELTISVKASDSLNYKTETELSGGAVVDNTVNSVASQGLDSFARSQSSSGTAVEIVMDVQKKAAEAIDDSIKGNILSSARGPFLSLGYADSDIKRAYLDIDIKKFTAAGFDAIDTSGEFTDVTDTGTPIEIALNVGTDVTRKRPVIVRVHEGTTTRFTELGSRPSSSYQDGRYYVDKSHGIIYMYSRYFSVYSLVYANTVPCTVTFDSAGGSAVSSVSLKGGNTVTKPADPVRDKYTFEGWLLGGGIFNFTTPITCDITLTAEWKAVKTTTTGTGSTGTGTSRSRTSGSVGASRSRTTTGTTKSTTTSRSGSSYSGSSSSTSSLFSGSSSYNKSSNTYSNPWAELETYEENETETVMYEPEMTEEEAEIEAILESEDIIEATTEKEDSAEKEEERAERLNIMLLAGAVITGILFISVIVWLLYEMKQLVKELAMRNRKSRAV